MLEYIGRGGQYSLGLGSTVQGTLYPSPRLHCPAGNIKRDNIHVYNDTVNANPTG